ncbi:hypothetical protein [Roseivivax isoporae]|uniref:Uncharacterized protein n=1 Tax=Roseivivax isoporae LMG 25204 TaxID=1449351 RepID=X7F3G5_9RHOB|nr:hypothetical protein [Roseivivax isoporae]ETX26574.1 hypothetical protein RISW2_21965 [Roseivivax isoporae LMG 25204]
MSLDQIFVLALLGIVFLSVFREIYPPEVTTLGVPPPFWPQASSRPEIS